MCTEDAANFEKFERLRLAVAERSNQSHIAALVPEARQEQKNRAYRWVYTANRAPAEPTVAMHGEHSGNVPSFFSLARYYLAGLSVVAGVAAYLAISPLVGIATGVTGFVGVVGLQLRANMKRSRVLLAGSCLRCGYDLESLPQALSPAAVGGLKLGPLRCPECGRLWPAIPLPDGSA